MAPVSPRYLHSSEAQPNETVPVAQANQESSPSVAFALISAVLILVAAVWGRQRLQQFVQRKYQMHRTLVLLQRIVALERLLSPRPLSRK